jgi:hypothetical protein
MRYIMAVRLTNSKEISLGEVVLGEATASYITDAFFGMCRITGDPTASEQKIADALRAEVKAVIEKRNDIAHGDWWHLPDKEVDGHEPDAVLVRIRPVRREGHEKIESLNASDIDELSDGLRVLVNIVNEFGLRSLGLSDSSVRVGDIFAVKKKRVTRCGPLAAETEALLYRDD